MKFQLAMDLLTLDEAKTMAEELKNLAQIIEIGTPMLIKEGCRAVREMKNAVPELKVLADTKIMDAGYLEAEEAFLAGADIVTVCGAAEDATIAGAIEAAAKYGGQVLVDMIAVDNLAKRAEEIDAMGPDYIQVHTAFDGRGDKTPVGSMKLVSPLLKKAGLAVAGGLGPDIISDVAAENPDIIVLGSKVVGTEDPERVLKEIYSIIGAEK